MKKFTLGTKILNSALSVILTVGLMPSLAWAEGESSSNILTLDEPSSVTIASAGEEALLSFTAPESGSYTFTSSGNLDTVGYLYPDQTKAVVLATDDDKGVDSNFKICWTLDAGKTVYLLVYLYGDSTGTFDVTVTQGSDDSESNTIREGEWIFDANYHSYIDDQGVLHMEYRLQTVSGSVRLTEDTDYQVTISQNGTPITGTPTQPGVYEYTATGIGKYSGSITNYFAVCSYNDLAAANYDVPREFSYTGEAIDTSKIVVTDALGNTVASSNYELLFYNDDDEQLSAVPSELGAYIVRIKATTDGSYISTNWDNSERTGYDILYVDEFQIVEGPSAPEATTLTLGIPQTVEAGAGDEILFSFTASEANTYYFNATGNIGDLASTLFSSAECNWSEILDYSESGVYLKSELAEGQTVYLLVLNKDQDNGATYSLCVTARSDNNICNDGYGGWVFDTRYSPYFDTLGQLHISYYVGAVSGSIVLNEGTDYEIAIYKDNAKIEGMPTQPGVYRYVATGIGDYCGSRTNYFYIYNYNDLAVADVDIPQTFAYTGNSIDTSKITVADALGNTLVEGQHYEFCFYDEDWAPVSGTPSEKGTYTVRIIAVEDSGYTATNKDSAYPGVNVGEFSIVESTDLSSATATIWAGTNCITLADGTAVFSYTDSEFSFSTELVLGEENLCEGTDYTVTFSATEFGKQNVSGVATFTGTGSYVGTVTANYILAGENSLYSAFGVTDTAKTTGDPVDFESCVTVKLYPSYTILDYGTDYIVSKVDSYDPASDAYTPLESTSITQPGMYRLTLQGIGSCSDETICFLEVIDPRDIANAGFENTTGCIDLATGEYKINEIKVWDTNAGQREYIPIQITGFAYYDDSTGDFNPVDKPTQAGFYQVTVVPTDGVHIGSKTVDCRLYASTDLQAATLNISKDQKFLYTGEAVDIVVYDGMGSVIDPDNYVLNFINTDTWDTVSEARGVAGYYVYASAAGGSGYTNWATGVTFSICNPGSFDDCSFVLANVDNCKEQGDGSFLIPYTTQPLNLGVNVYDDDNLWQLSEGVDYTFEVSGPTVCNPKEELTGTITVTGIGIYAGESKTINYTLASQYSLICGFQISSAQYAMLSNGTVDFSSFLEYYDYNANLLTYGTDYVVSAIYCEDTKIDAITKVDLYWVTIEGRGSYTGSVNLDLFVYEQGDVRAGDLITVHGSYVDSEGALHLPEYQIVLPNGEVLDTVLSDFEDYSSGESVAESDLELGYRYRATCSPADTGYWGSYTVIFTVYGENNLAAGSITVEGGAIPYTGSAIDVGRIVVKDSQGNVVSPDEYTLYFLIGEDISTAAPTECGLVQVIAAANDSSEYQNATSWEQFRIAKVKVEAPVAKSGLVYNGKTQTGVAAAEGYTVTGGSALHAGSYTATATLDEGYF